MRHYANEIGLNILVDCGTDVSGISVGGLRVRLPDKTTIVEWVASPYYYNGVPNYLLYVTAGGDLTQPGIYKIQAHVIKRDSFGEIVWETFGETTSLAISKAFE